MTVDWTTLDGYFQRLERNQTPINIGTYVGAAQVREAVMGSEDRVPTQTELEQMKTLVVRAMKDGALGLSTALIYAPGHFAKAKELIALAKVAASMLRTCAARAELKWRQLTKPSGSAERRVCRLKFSTSR